MVGGSSPGPPDWKRRAVSQALARPRPPPRQSSEAASSQRATVGAFRQVEPPGPDEAAPDSALLGSTRPPGYLHGRHEPTERRRIEAGGSKPCLIPAETVAAAAAALTVTAAAAAAAEPLGCEDSHASPVVAAADEAAVSSLEGLIGFITSSPLPAPPAVLFAPIAPPPSHLLAAQSPR